jgi:hypothetical protein
MNWTPCQSCPRRQANGGDGSEESCPARTHPAFCRYAASSPETWSSRIRGNGPASGPLGAPVRRLAEQRVATRGNRPTRPAPTAKDVRHVQALRFAATCPYRSRVGCGCNELRCWARDGLKLRVRQCTECAERILFRAIT